MALLPDSDRLKIWRALMREWSNLRESCNFLKQHLSDAVNATDQWIEDNQASYNNALPAQFRNNATVAQKTLLFCYVAMKRASRKNPDED